MKNFKVFLITLITVFTFNSSFAQVAVKVYPKRGIVVTKINKPSVVVHKKVNYYYADGVWYTKKQRAYVVVGAPVGVTVRRLPRGRRVVKINGRKYYKYRGVVYKKQRRRYIVVNV